ncbi:MAG TPA: lactate utilization protein, partial [Thermoanaerobaculia bacterium]|nr:lactate utilization protein [Thermoanaerobaculia bacterium]
RESRMPDGSRERILERLSRGASAEPAGEPDFGVMARRAVRPEERYARLRRAMEAVHAEFLETNEEDWPGRVRAFAETEGIRSIAYGPGTGAAGRLESAFGGSPVRLVRYDRSIEEMKGALFDEVDAGFTTTRGGIADTGGLILWPSPEEPRLLSLVPPVHLALLDVARIHGSFWQAIRDEGWAVRMPPNALLVSGPSKTADIEQTLAYGVHGPKRLVVIAVLPRA